MPALRLSAAALLLSIAAASGSANAQNATLRLTWTPSGGAPKTCVFTADSTGVNMDGNGALTATGNFATADCPSGGGGGVADPVFTNPLDASDLPSPVLVGTSTTVNWAATADSCTYNNVFPAGATVTNWPATGTACANATDCAQTHTAAITYPAIAGSYQFGLTCTKVGAANPVTTTRTVTVNPMGGGGETCVAPSGLSRVTSLYVEYNAGSSTGRTVDGTKFEEVFGHNPTGSTRMFPGTSNLNQRVFIPRNGYVALKFTVPSNLPVQTYGMFRFEETQPQTNPARMSMTISKSCGDFATTATAPLTNRCVLNDANVTSNNNFMWGYYPGGNMCQLVPGETYYLNIIHAGLSAPTTSYCAAGSCGNTVQNQKGGGTGWPTVIGGDTE